MIAIKLAKQGYGSPNEILNWDTMDVIVMLEYEKFLQDYDQEFQVLNKEKTK